MSIKVVEARDMTTRELADHLSRVFENRPLDDLPEVVPALSGERTKNDMIAIAEYLRSEREK